MRAKYATQIRTGVEEAIRDIRWTRENGYPPPKPYALATELEWRAYDRTLKHQVAKEIAAVGRDILAKVHEKWPETKPTQDAVYGPETSAAIRDLHQGSRHPVAFLGGPYNGVETHLRRTPERVQFGKHTYEKIYDPETGDFLNAYAYVEEQS